MLPRSFTKTVIAQFPKYEGLTGAAFLLRTPSKIDAIFTRPEGIVTLRAEAPLVTVQLNKTHSSTELRNNAWQVIQESLDIYAATHRHALATYRGEQDYLLWAQRPAGYELTIVDTIESKWGIAGTVTVSPPPLIVSASASVVAKTTPNSSPLFLPHHEAFRFLRMSLFSEDLFDAYRNAYLALECLISDESAKLAEESEHDWLLRVLSGQLAAAIPGGIVIEDAV